MVVSTTPFLTDSLKNHENVVFNIDWMGIMTRNALTFAHFQDSVAISPDQRSTCHHSHNAFEFAANLIMMLTFSDPCDFSQLKFSFCRPARPLHESA